MSYLVYLSLLPPVLMGAALIALLTLPTGKSNLLLILSLGIPAGFGISACLYFLWSYLFNPSFPGIWVVDVLLTAIFLFLLWKQKPDLKQLIPNFKNWSRLDWGLCLIFCVVLVIGLATFAAYTNANPHGRYDAWAIWNVRARMIARGGINWKSVFIPQVFHADYPLLVPLTIARSWVIAGTESQRIPPAVAGLFTFAGAGILTGTLFSLARKQAGWLAGIIFLTTPWVIYFGSLQFADLPLAACILSACACLALAFFDRPFSARWLVLSGLFAGLAGWVKNEGQLFVVAFVVIAALSWLIAFRKQSLRDSVFPLVIGLIIPVFVILLFKLTLAPANDVVDAGNPGQAFSQLISLPRYGEVITAYQNYPKGFGGWTLPLPLAFIFLWLLFKPALNSENKGAIFTVAGLLAFQWIGYFLIFVITPHALQTHINQSYDRLLMHIYPAFLLWLFLFLPSLKESVGISQHS